MDSSRRAVESYWRSRMIDGVTSDEDKVAPVYKLEEVCELLRSSHVSIVKEVSEFILKKLDHKSPLVKQKALRLLKYSLGKSGVEFKREIQRNSAAIRQLFHYKGQLDPLKGDALNKAVRDSAHEAMTAIFASEDNKPTPPEDINKRIQGFGNTNLEMPTEDKKSFLSDMMGLGSASIRQGLSTIASAHSLKKSDNGSYKGPHLRRSLTKESERPEIYEREDHSRESWISPVVSKDVSGGVWGQNLMPSTKDARNSEYGHIRTGANGREERLLETIVTSGGVRLQPTREALQVFLTEASKVDAVALSHVLELKLQSHLWQVRMKAVCVLEAILRKKDDAHCSIIASYFGENPEFVHNCTETPQASLREKANKVLSLLGGEQTSNAAMASNAKTETAAAIEIPDLIDTGDLDEYGREDPIGKQIDPNVPNEVTPVAPVIDDLFGDKFVTNINEDEKDTFADVSFLSSEERQQNTDDLFSGLTIDYSKQAAEGNVTTPTNSSNSRPDLFDIFGGTISKQSPQESSTIPKKDVNDLMGGLSFHASSVPDGTQQDSGRAFSKAALSHLGNQFSHPTSNEDFIGVIGSQSETLNSSVPNPLFPLGASQYGTPQNFMLNPAYASQQINYNAMRSFFAQQQLLAMSNFQNMGNISSLGNAELGSSPYKSMEGAHSLPVPDIFHLTNNPVQNSSIASNTKKEETKAFDFISDHLSSARDSRRVI